MTLVPYPSYQRTGQWWLPQIPAHWTFPPLSLRYDVVLGKMLDAKRLTGAHPLPYLRNVDVQWDRVNTVDLPVMDIGPHEHERYTLKAGDLLVCEGGEVGRTAGWRGELDACAFQKALHRLRPLSPAEHPRFLFYCMRFACSTQVFEVHSNLSTIPHLTGEQLRRYRFPCPPLAEQVAIAEFLDDQTARIDALVAEQRRLMVLLQEKRQAVITHAVTKGLNPDAPLKPSGVEWLGKVPTDWVVMPVARAARLESGHTPSRQHPEYWMDCTVPWFTLADVWQIREGKADYVTDTKEKVSEVGLANSAARLLPKGTVMLSRTASVGFAAIMGTDMATTQDFANWVCGDQLLPEFLLYVFRAMQPEFKRLMMGSTHNTIYMPDIQALRFALPPVDAQHAIAAHLMDVLGELDGLTAEVSKAEQLLLERRAALIAAAVTGQSDVRQLAAVEAA